MGKALKSRIKLCAAALAVFDVGISAQTSQPHPPRPPFPQIDLPQKARARTKSSGPFTFTVTGISLSGYTCVPTNNAVTSATN